MASAGGRDRELSVPYYRLEHAADLPAPERETTGSAGLDLRAAVESELSIAVGERALVPTGICLALPRGFEGQIRPRSGLARRHGVTVLNSPGTVDSDYRGEVQVLLVNLGAETFVVRRGDRIAQLVIAAHAGATLEEVDELPMTGRGGGGFGSTGVG